MKNCKHIYNIYISSLNKDNLTNQLWLAYAYFHSGDFPKALQIYNELLKKPNCDPNIYTYKACCLYALCKFKEGLEEAKKGVPTELNVCLFYIMLYIYIHVEQSTFSSCVQTW